MGNSSFEQSDFGAGIYRGRKAPAASVYDALNALVDDEGQLFRRGTSALYSTSDAAATILRMVAGYMPAVSDNRVLFSTAANRYVLNGSLAPTLTGVTSPITSRPTMVGNYMVTTGTPSTNAAIYYAGTLKSSQYITGTVTVTNGSAIVTGSGTSWLANADAGMVFFNAGGPFAVVKKVDSNTQITLTDSWAGSTAAGAAYSLEPSISTFFFGYGSSRAFVAAAGSGSPRLLYCIGHRVYFTESGDPFTFTETSYHEVPGDALIVGAEGVGDAALIFTTRGVWRISNLSFDPVDDAGNVQHIVEQISKDVVLWDDFGIAGWDQGLVVPAIDDVYLFSLDGEVRSISAAIRPLYRSYVKAGYQLGTAAVHRGHYFVTVLNGTTVVDTLVCRLDRAPFPWTRWAGHVSGPAHATLIAEAARTPKLIGVSGVRITDLTGCMDVTSSSGQDANSTTPTFRVDENDIDTGAGIRPNTTEKVRYVYETTGGTPTISVSYATGPEGSSYTAATLKRGGGASTGIDYSAWKVVEKAERIRFRFECTSQVTSLILRRREATIREQAQS